MIHLIALISLFRFQHPPFLALMGGPYAWWVPSVCTFSLVLYQAVNNLLDKHHPHGSPCSPFSLSRAPVQQDQDSRTTGILAPPVSSIKIRVTSQAHEYNGKVRNNHSKKLAVKSTRNSSEKKVCFGYRTVLYLLDCLFVFHFYAYFISIHF